MQTNNPIYFGLYNFLLLIILSPASAQENLEREGFRMGLDLGGGMVKRTFPEGKADETLFYMGFFGGYWVNSHVVAGVELSGWLLQADPIGPEDPDKGEGIGRVFLYTQLYPSTDTGWFVRVSGGYINHWSNNFDTQSRKGLGFTFGGGYDFSVYEKTKINPFVNYSFGDTDDENHKAITLGIGFTYEF